LPGIIWSSGGEFNRLKDRNHLRNAYEYIRTKQERGTVVWSHRPDENWIDDPTIGIVVITLARKQLRIFQQPPDAGV
jgi:hypothetical protein